MDRTGPPQRGRRIVDADPSIPLLPRAVIPPGVFQEGEGSEVARQADAEAIYRAA
jgi:hypothetical protein